MILFSSLAFCSRQFSTVSNVISRQRFHWLHKCRFRWCKYIEHSASNLESYWNRRIQRANLACDCIQMALEIFVYSMKLHKIFRKVFPIALALLLMRWSHTRCTCGRMTRELAWNAIKQSTNSHDILRCYIVITCTCVRTILHSTRSNGPAAGHWSLLQFHCRQNKLNSLHTLAVIILPVNTRIYSLFFLSFSLFLASGLKGYTKPREYVVTEWPLKHTVGEFWSLVYDQECSAVVVLCQPPPNSVSIHLEISVTSTALYSVCKCAKYCCNWNEICFCFTRKMLFFIPF